MKKIHFISCLVYFMLFVSCKSKQEKLVEANYNKYKENTLNTGDTPYSSTYGLNTYVNEDDYSRISVTTSSESNVIVSVKNNEQRVVYHAYIKSDDMHSFSLPNGTYQIFFYYGTGWDPNKKMKVGGKVLKGGFLDNESFGKDEVKDLYDVNLDYTLINQINGNFSTEPSNISEAF